MFCTKCGNKLHDGDVFCARCGTRVRKEETGQSESRYSDVVFNPPFKLEAQRRTEEISREIKEYSSEPKRESLDFNWNLDGFPGSRSSKDDEDFKFNWDDVLEKKNRSREVNVKKIVPIDEKTADEQKEAADRQSEVSGTFAELGNDTRKEEAEAGLSIEELERELFGEAPSQVSQDAEKELEMTLQYRREDIDGAKDKFYTYNAKRDAFQELLDREKAHIEKLEEEHRAQWQSLTASGEKQEPVKEPPAFEDIFVEPAIFRENPLQEVGIAMPPKTAVLMAQGEAEQKSCNGDESVETAETACKNGIAQDEARGEASTIAAAALGTAALGVAAGAAVNAAACEEGEAAANGEVGAEECEKLPKEPPAEQALTEPDAGAEESGDAKQEAEAYEEREDSAEAPPFQPEGDSETEAGEEVEEEHKEKAKLRFSDVFPRDVIDADSGVGDGCDDASGKEEKAEKIRFEDFGEDDEDDEEVRKGRRPVLKIIIIFLAILVAIEVVVIGVKLIAPESGFSKGVDKFIASVTSVFTGKDEGANASKEPVIETTYITEYINETSAGASNIGNISENISLRYDSDKEYAFEELSTTSEFENSVWKTGDDGKDIYSGRQIVESVIIYYNQLKDKETLPEGTVGINKLEIGEIRTGEAGYYVLTKITYANEDGGETAVYESVHLASSANEIAVKEVKEEKL
mgnify:CR=1 FL=1